MDEDKLREILDAHRKWLSDNMSGKQADLQGADLKGASLRWASLRGANLKGADLRGADLRWASLQWASLRWARLRRADLRWADLSHTIYENINWLPLIGISPSKTGRAFKLINEKGEGIFKGGINYLHKKTFSVKNVDNDINRECSYGINLATLSWCILNRQYNNRLLIMEFDTSPENCVCPINSDGKFRVKKCTKVGECDWQGNLIKEGL